MGITKVLLRRKLLSPAGRLRATVKTIPRPGLEPGVRRSAVLSSVKPAPPISRYLPTSTSGAGASLAERVAEGLRAHQAGDRAAAEQIYRAVLAMDPDHADALHLLGTVVATRNLAEGVELIERAIAASPRVSAYHNNLGSLALRAGDPARAERHYRRALRLDDRNPEATLNLGKVLHAQGHTGAARVTLGRAVVLGPRSVEARMSLGRAEEELRAWSAALACYRKAAELDPLHAPAYLALGKAHKALGEQGQAEACLLRAIEIDSDYADAHYNLGNLRREKGELSLAITSYRRAIDLDPLRAHDARNNLGVALAEAGRQDEAVAALTQAIEQKPDSIDALFNLGKEMARRAAIQGGPAAGQAVRMPALRGDADFDATRASAYDYFGRVLALKPDHLGALSALGDLKGRDGDDQQAVSLYRRAIAMEPHGAPAAVWNNLGAALINLAERAAQASDYVAPDFGEALAAIRMALKIDPNHAGAWFNLAKIAAGKDDPAEAFDALRRSIELAPENPDAYQDLGALEEQQGLLEDAVGSYRRALALNPHSMPVRSNLAALLALLGDPQGLIQLRALVGEQRDQPGSAHAHWTLCMALLRLGLYQEGWAEHEWRVKTKDLAGRQRCFDPPRWAGEPLEGRTILLYAEQGFGDTIQFARYAPLVAARGGRVVLEVQPALKSLLAGLEGVAECVGRGEPLPGFAVHASLMSLPYLLRMQDVPPPAPLPLGGFTPAATVPAAAAPLRVGLVWAGNSKLKRDRLRSAPLAALKPLASVPGAQFTSLQIGAGADQIACDGVPFGFTLADAEQAGRPREFAETASRLAELDLVITVDTAVAHLAGALGKPVWILLDRTQDWRWGVDGETTPWYPSARLFRQTACSPPPRRPDWTGVVERVAGALEMLVESRS